MEGFKYLDQAEPEASGGCTGPVDGCGAIEIPGSDTVPQEIDEDEGESLETDDLHPSDNERAVIPIDTHRSGSLTTRDCIPSTVLWLEICLDDYVPYDWTQGERASDTGIAGELERRSL